MLCGYTAPSSTRVRVKSVAKEVGYDVPSLYTYAIRLSQAVLELPLLPPSSEVPMRKRQRGGSYWFWRKTAELTSMPPYSYPGGLFQSFHQLQTHVLQSAPSSTACASVRAQVLEAPSEGTTQRPKENHF